MSNCIKRARLVVMMRRLRTVAASQQGVFTYEDAIGVGMSGNDLTALVKRGEIIRLRHRAYVLADVWAAARTDTQYRLRVLAVMRTRPRYPERFHDRASHHSALAMLGVSFFNASRSMVLIESESGPQRPRDGMTLLRRSTAETYRQGEIRLVGAAAACVQVAARDGFEAGVVAMDNALHLGRCTLQDLEQCVDVAPRARRSQVRRCIAVADARSESVGESRTRIILLDAGFTVEPQVEIRSGRELLGRVDFLVDGCVVVEFDGLVKYEGIEGKHAIAAEKAREKKIRGLGYEFVRLVWSELAAPASIARQVVQAKRDAERRGVLSPH